MKLRTEMLGFESKVLNPVDRLDTYHDACKHDAMAAHALLQAMGEWWERPSEADSCTDAAVTWIEQRADEIMREWR